ncbi:gamma-soluble NSF attachment protein-like [Phalaenopsis equestris]|uniref:gamma-soluble NSF attachment protein-like n=1 Tax=Phalaenopsis equestris TaxID=78828 RepID=UPI0009E1E378|nr:gamma-soluble NSF attachment protein-like [Phalaenopsis equestris]
MWPVRSSNNKSAACLRCHKQGGMGGARVLDGDNKLEGEVAISRSNNKVRGRLAAGRYIDAATSLLRWGVAADACNAVNSQCKAYLSAIIVYLYLHDFKQARKCYDDCTQIAAFLSSDQNRCASKLLSAYREGDIEEIKRVAQSSPISHLDHVIIRLARKLPTGDLDGLKIEDADEHETLNEDDLT